MVVIKGALKKDTLRNITKSLGRFLSILTIVALGVAFLSGLKISPEVMKSTADKYYDDYNLMDIRIVSNLGLTDDDLYKIGKIEGVEKVFGTYTLDVLAAYDEKEVVLRIHGLNSDNNINSVNLIEGRLPQASDEAVIEKGKNDSITAPLGSTIKLSSGKHEPLTDNLKNTEYKVVGFVQTPYYLSFEKGSSNIGNGQIRNFIMIPQENFKLDVFTEIFATVKGAKTLNSYNDEYFHLVDKVTHRIKGLANERANIRYEDILEEGTSKLEKGKKEYFQERDKALEKLSEAEKKIQDAKLEIENGEKKLIEEERRFQLSIKEGREKIVRAEEDLLKGQEEYEKGLKIFIENKILAEQAFKKANADIKKGEESIVLLQGSITQINAALENPLLQQEERQKLIVDLETTKSILTGTKQGIESGKKELEQSKLELIKVEEELNKTKTLLISSKQQLDIEKDNLNNGEKRGIAEFRKAQEEFQRGKMELLDAEEEYKTSKEKAEKELSDAWSKIEDAQTDLNKIEKGKWYVLDRNSHYSYVDYGGAADSIDALAKVFPLFFALVAALVCLTTMTRMVDEQRGNIGTLKALGYGNLDIASKYILYALMATLFGSVLGISLGFTVFPIVIFNSYGIMYILPPATLLFNWTLAISISLVAIGITTLTAFLACINELRETPSSLMRPKAPKVGKRIFLERIPFIWNRLNFSSKVTTRNIFRYKRRFFMTVFGIAGCTALILSAFGIKDSIRTIVDRQFGTVFTYDMTIRLESDSEKYIYDDDRISSYELIGRESGILSLNNLEKDIAIIVPRDIKNVENFIHLQNRKNEKHIKIPEKGVIITEQVSRNMGIKVGDEISLINSDDKEAKTKVSGIAENYLFNYVYLSPGYYKEIFNENVEFNEAIGTIKDTTEDSEDNLSRDLMEKEGISNVSFNTATKEDFEDTIRSLNYAVLVMIVSAGALAFVVLYNLTNVNISERIREIATIKVLGFYDNEVSAYIYRENTVLTLIGTAVGLVIGIFLHRYIMITVEMENMMFGLTLNIKSYIISVILTLGFAVFVNMAMYYKLRNVEMVESLKSVD